MPLFIGDGVLEIAISSFSCKSVFLGAPLFQDAMNRGQVSPARSLPGDPASSQPSATKTYSHALKSSRLFLVDDNSRGERSLYSRADAEHVVLADCRSPKGILSSEMAYFAGSPKSNPDDTAIVDTPYNTTRNWANARTSTLFPDTNITFTAVLRPDVAQGDWAGTGDNGYGSFVCWEKSLPELYHDEAVGTECAGVYDCDHEATPSKLAFLPKQHLTALRWTDMCYHGRRP